MARAQTAPLQNMQRELANLNRQMNQLGALGGKIDSDFDKATTTFSKFDAKMRAAGGSILAVTAALAGLSAAVGAALKKSTDAAVDFDAAMRNVNSIARLSEESYAALVRKTLALGGAQEVGGRSARELAGALYQVFSSGIGISETATDVQNISQALEVARLSALGARAGLADTKETARAFLGVINAYKLAAAGPAELAHVMDVLFETVNKGVVEFPELSQSLGVVVGIAAQAGVSIEELGAVIAHTTRRGEQANRVVYGMGQLLLEIITPTKDQREAMEELAKKTGRAGLEMSATALKAMGFTEWLRNVAEAAAEAASGEQDVMDILVKIIPSARAARTFFALATDQAADFRTMVKEMGNASNIASGAMKGMSATEAALAEQAKSAQFSLDRLSASMHRASVVVGDVMRPQVGAFAQSMSGLVDAFSALSPEVHTFVANAGIALVSFLGLAAAVGGFLLIAGPLTVGITTLAGPVLVLGAAVGVAIAAFKAWEGNIGGVRGALAALGTQLGVAAGEFATGMRIGAGGPTAVARAEAAAIGAIPLGLVPGAPPSVAQQAGAALAGAMTAARTAADLLAPSLDIVRGIVSVIQVTAAQMATEWGIWLQQNALLDAWNKLLGGTASALRQVGDAARFAWEEVLVPVLTAFAGNVAPALRLAFEGIVQSMNTLHEVVRTNLGPAIETLGPTFQMIGEIWDSVWRLALEPVLKGLAAFLGVTLVAVVAVAAGALSGAAAAIGPLFGGMARMVVGALQIVIGIIQIVVGVVKGAVAVGEALLTGNWAKAWERAQLAVHQAAQGVENILKGLHLVMQGIFDAVVGTLAAFGRGFIAGVTGIFSSALEAAKRVLGQRSPSEEFRKIAVGIGEGLEAGLEASKPRVLVATGGILGDMLDATSAIVPVMQTNGVRAGIALARGIASTADVVKAVAGKVAKDAVDEVAKQVAQVFAQIRSGVIGTLGQGLGAVWTGQLGPSPFGAAGGFRTADLAAAGLLTDDQIRRALSVPEGVTARFRDIFAKLVPVITPSAHHGGLVRRGGLAELEEGEVVTNPPRGIFATAPGRLHLTVDVRSSDGSVGGMALDTIREVAFEVFRAVVGQAQLEGAKS